MAIQRKAARPTRAVPAKKSVASAKGAPTARKSLVHTGGDFWKSQEEEQERQKQRKELREKGLDKIFRHWLKPGDEVEAIILDEAPEKMVTRREHELRNPGAKGAPIYEPCVVDAGLNCPVCSKVKDSYFGVFMTVLIVDAYEDKESGEWRNARRLVCVKSGQGPTFKRILNAAMKEHGTTRGVTLLLQRDTNEKSSKIGEPIEYEDTGKRYGFLTEDELAEYANEEIKTREGKVIVEAGVDIEPLDYALIFDMDKDPSEILEDLQARYGDGAQAGSAREVAETWQDDEKDEPAERGTAGARGTRSARPVRSQQPAVSKRRSRVHEEPEPEPEEEAEPTWTELGVMVDEEGDADACVQLTDAAKTLGINPDDYPTWAGLGEELDAYESEEEPEEEEEEEPEEEVESWTTYGTQIDEGEDTDGSVEDAMRTEAEAAELNPDEYPTWAELGEALDALEESEEEEEEEEPEPEPERSTPVRRTITRRKPSADDDDIPL